MDRHDRLPLLGYPGTWTAIGGRTPSYSATLSPRVYSVRFLFGIPAMEPYQLADDGQSVTLFTELPGDSPFKFSEMDPDTMREIGFTLPGRKRLKAELRVNSLSRLSSVTVVGVEAENALEAVHEAGEYFLPHLNWLCYRFDVGVNVAAIDALDETHSDRWTYFYRPYEFESITFSELSYSVPEQMMPLLALFREAMSSTNPYYQVIVLRKILEGVNLAMPEFGRLQPDGLLEERFPVHDRIPQPLRGKKFGAFLEDMRTNRNVFSHFVNDDLDVIHVPDMMQGRRHIDGLMPALRYATKVKLENLRLRMCEAYKQSGHELTSMSSIKLGLDTQ